jgi:hypothetical protein
MEVEFRAFHTTAVVEVSGEFLVRSGLYSVLILWKVGWLAKTIAAREGNRSTYRCLSVP